MKADNMSFEQQYIDGSGVQFAVRLKTRQFGLGGGQVVEQFVEFERCGEVHFPLGQLDWLIGCLNRIKQEVGDGR